jgi:hypothetical protein
MESDMSDISDFIDGIKAAGVHIANEGALVKQLASADDWRAQFSDLAMTGHRAGITFTSRGIDCEGVDVLSVGMAFGAAGFEQRHARQFVNSVLTGPAPTSRGVETAQALANHGHSSAEVEQAKLNVDAPLQIDLEHYASGRVLTGRPFGAELRAKYGLDQTDGTNQVVEVRIPKYVYSLTSSFFLSCFGPSVVASGSLPRFFDKFRFDADPSLQEAFSDYAARALQEDQILNGEPH